MIPPFPTRLPDLRRAVLALVSQIPHGQVTTYGDLARALGDPQVQSARWIAEFLNGMIDPTGAPTHRVVRQTGEVGQFPTGSADKIALLKVEEVPFLADERVDLPACRFREFNTRRPLHRLKVLQDVWAGCAVMCGLPNVQRVAGMDVAYVDEFTAVGAMTIWEASVPEVRTELAVTRRIAFPYIPGFLSFRELPVLLALWRQAEQRGMLPDLVFVDGNGRLHPRRAGIATCFGVLTQTPTIGVGKSLLCGSFDRRGIAPGQPQAVIDGGELIGHAVQADVRSRPVFVSAGNLITQVEAVEWGMRMFRGHRVPEPIYLADRLTKQQRDRLRGRCG